ncbi:MAG: hypothetical protein MMC23_003327 [Stictis urceolatum]|nr:hypothetical protein [Stictis urceolata]
MADERPSTAVTLPRNFHFHEYSQEQPPKTPEPEFVPQDEDSVPVQQPSRPPQRYLLRRYKKQSRMNLRPSLGLGLSEYEDVPIPTVEIDNDHEAPSISHIDQHQVVGEPSHAGGLVAPNSGRRRSLPRTPPPQSMLSSCGTWSPIKRKTTGELIGHPNSAFSLESESSDDSDADSDDGLSYGGSCTSPESEVGSLGFRPVKARGSVSRVLFGPENPLTGKKGKAPQTQWTSEMDNHLWTCYMKYLSDPTVTPFKSWPGAAPPLGVCRRVAREAKRMWKSPKPVGPMLRREKSSETIKAMKSGSNTPTESSNHKKSVWPKSTAATRRRFRAICKRKASIAPHYQRMLKSRSPEPFTSSDSHAHDARLSNSGIFATRDVRLALATSTSVTMQPDAPLAQFAGEEVHRPQSSSSWFNDPSVAWASPAPQPSSESNTMLASLNEDSSNFLHPTRFSSDSPQPSQLASPFQYHTWTSGQIGKRPRRSTRPSRLDNASASIPRLRSPFELHGTGTGTYPYPSNHKRRALSQLEEELSPGGSGTGPRPDDDVFGLPIDPSHRRVRARGFSYGDALTQGRLPRNHMPSSQPGRSTIHRFSTPPPLDPTALSSPSLQPPAEIESQGCLGSPFAGISSRPTRSRRHVSLTTGPLSWDPPAYPSIDQTLNDRA